jgi:hypothetical protein
MTTTRREMVIRKSHVMYLFEFEELTAQNRFHDKRMDIVYPREELPNVALEF